MRQIITIFISALLLIGCNSVKRNQKFLAKGNYHQAIALAVKKLQKNKYSEKNEEHILLLEEAFKKAADRDEWRISSLKKENDLNALRDVYWLYRALEKRQVTIRPLLPLHIGSQQRNAKFKLKDYTNKKLAAKQLLGDRLLMDGQAYLKSNNKIDARRAFDLLDELIDLRPHDALINSMIEEAIYKGTDFVFVTLTNRSGHIMPRRLEQELLDFNTYDLDDFWTEFHSERQQDISYSYGVALNFRRIDFSPEHLSEKEVRRTKRIKDGWEYKRDRNGVILKDEEGKPIKLDIYKTVSAILTVTEQSKAAIVGGNVVYRDIINRRDMEEFPLATEFIFENIFATYLGDERALSDDDLVLTQNRFVRFPTNAQLLLDASDDIKGRLKDILKDNSFE